MQFPVNSNIVRLSYVRYSRMAPMLLQLRFQYGEISAKKSSTFPGAVSHKEGERTNVGTRGIPFAPSSLSCKFLEELAATDAFDLASSVNGFSVRFLLSLPYSLHIVHHRLSFPWTKFAESSRVFFNCESFSRSTNPEMAKDVPASSLYFYLRPTVRPRPVVLVFPLTGFLMYSLSLLVSHILSLQWQEFQRLAISQKAVINFPV